MCRSIRGRVTSRRLTPSPFAKVAAAGVILAAVGFALAISLYARRSLAAKDPLVPPVLSAETTPDVAKLALSTSSETGTRVLLYVTETCPYCVIELSRWRRADEATDGAPSIVIIAPEPLPDSLLPSSAIMVSDPSGTMARELGVRAVPALFVMGDGGVVIDARAGLNTPVRIEHLLRGAAFNSESEDY